jgi:predicted phage terminase large subunit-like protein
VLWDAQTHQEKRRNMGPYTYAAQILLNPKADALQGFERDWLRFYTTISPSQAKKMNKYILVDSANEKRKESDYTAMWVIGLGADGNYYALDIVRDRLNLTERTSRLFSLFERWKPIKQVRWERYGLNADIQHIKTEQEHRNYRFDITEVAGITKKDDRIGRLIPLFEQGKIYLPKTFHVTNWEKQVIDVVRAFVEEEYAGFPVSRHKDMLDSLARIAEPDLELQWPKDAKVVTDPPRRYSQSQAKHAWMS